MYKCEINFPLVLISIYLIHQTRYFIVKYSKHITRITLIMKQLTAAFEAFRKPPGSKKNADPYVRISTRRETVEKKTTLRGRRDR